MTSSPVTPSLVTLDDARYALDLCARIAAHTDVPGTITRLFLSPATRDVHSLLLAEMQALGMATHTSPVGNLHALYPSASAEEPASAPLLLGSHIDTVPDAGAYDGILGVALPLALLRAFHREHIRLPFPVELIAFSEEEGVRFRLPFIGSSFFTRTLPAEALTATDADGITLAEAILPLSSPPWLSSRSAAEGSAGPLAAANPFAFLELHIEQGPVLESLSLPLGVVTTVVGQSRFELTFTGTANHAGTTPMHLRHDALAAAAEFIHAAESHAGVTRGLVATVGVIQVTPGAVNVVPGTCTCSLDLRHADDSIRLHAAQHLLELAGRAARARGVLCASRATSTQSSVPMHPAMQSALADAIRATGHTPHLMPSGAGHDAMILAEAGIPSAMLFLCSPGGISHHPSESVLLKDVHAALQALAHLVQHLTPEARQA